jgi:hypothetical protein
VAHGAAGIWLMNFEGSLRGSSFKIAGLQLYVCFKLEEVFDHECYDVSCAVLERGCEGYAKAVSSSVSLAQIEMLTPKTVIRKL